MPPAPVTPDQLRQRATALRRLGSQLEGAAALDLHRRATEDTWIGPTPSHCHEALLGLRTRILGAAEDVRSRAAALERQAQHLDANGRIGPP
ncbi:MAG: hypothetical protein JWN39_2812 [Ilumatobacteraceae bacterium]|nr:hypothetical protein [Ilumatobacteraceae bacterium]